MNASKREIIKRACNEIAAQTMLVEREVEATSEIQALVEQIYAAADEIVELTAPEEKPLTG